MPLGVEGKEELPVIALIKQPAAPAVGVRDPKAG